MALSFEAMRKRGVTKRELWKKVIIRSLKLFGIGMFLANGYELSTWRIPGVLQYFSVSYFVTCATVLSLDSYTNDHLKRIKEKEKDFYDSINNWAVHPEDRFMGGLCYPPPSLTLFAYRYEWIVQGLLILVYVLITFVGKAPGCPRGYIGAGGIEQNGDYAECTGGIHRYIDIQLFTYDLIYHFPTCKSLYQCQAYDPEGFVGVISACTLTYLGLMAGRCVVQFDNHKSRLNRWLCWAVVLLLLAGGLCGFSKNEGVMPINKNLWTTSFVFVTAGGGLIMLSITYVFVDVLKIWDGAPFRYMGMNSILIYIGHDILGGFFPFSYQTDSTSHARQLQMNLIGVCCWAVLGYYFYRIKFFLKV
jgi:heparan-alpha-glucosaminide N-acetyltransferase